MPAARRFALAAVLAVAVWSAAGCGGDSGGASAGARVDPGPEHVHGLGVDPGDGSLLVATHSGLFRVAASERAPRRVGDSYRDVMGFTVLGPGSFLGSGHPDPRETDQPPLLGLIRSDDGGRRWTTVSLGGRADFHVLRAAGRRVYGYDSTSGRLLASRDLGASWESTRPPAPLFDLAVDPGDDDHLIAVTEAGLIRSRDGGRSWRPLAAPGPGWLAWPRGDRLYLVNLGGRVSRSSDGGRRWRRSGILDGQPVALTAHRDRLYVALHDGPVLESSDGGRRWTARTDP